MLDQNLYNYAKPIVSKEAIQQRSNANSNRV